LKKEPVVDKDLILAGKFVFTFTGKGGDSYTYMVEKLDDEDKWFVSLLTGPDNINNYTYLGMLNPTTGKVFPTKASKLKKDSKPFRGVNFVFLWIWAGKPEEITNRGGTAQQAGRCAKCARTLTSPESLASGIGPECARWL
jgi:hypothetical protein